MFKLLNRIKNLLKYFSLMDITCVKRHKQYKIHYDFKRDRFTIRCLDLFSLDTIEMPVKETNDINDIEKQLRRLCES